MVSTFSGPAGRGAMRAHRAVKREEAEAREVATPADRRRASREGTPAQRLARKRGAS